MSDFVYARNVKVGDIIVISSGIFRVQSIKVEEMITVEISPLGVKDPNNVPASYSAHPSQFIRVKQ